MRNLLVDLDLSAALIDEVHDAVIVRDLDDRIRFWNKGAECIYGWRAPEVVDQNLYDVLSPGDVDSFEQQRRILAETGAWVGELHQVTKEGKSIIVDSRWKLHRDESQRPLSVLMVNKDITEKKILEGNMLRAQRIETVGRLATSIAHDLNNVLSTMLMSMCSLPQEQMDGPRKDVFDSSQVCAEHATQLLAQLLCIAKDVDKKPTCVNVGHLVSETAKVLRSTFPPSIKIEVTVSPKVHSLTANPTHLYQVLLNLCLNARDAMPAGGTLAIGASNVTLDDTATDAFEGAAPGDYVLLSVADTGIGMSPELAVRIFEPFFTTKEKDRSTGLGLFTVNSIVKNHGGFIDLATETKRGTRFTLYLPAKTMYL
jgi:PAS domain S-box-containing protein